jgi:hypothetical protein
LAEGEHRAAGQAALSPGPPRLLLLAIFAGSLAAFAALFFALPVLYDTDSYYHLAIGRAYAQHGLLDGLPWARFSLMFDGFGDKEPLFHLLLAPFSLFGTGGGRLALAFLNAALVTLLAAGGWRLLGGRAGLWLPLLVYAGSLDFLGRTVRLRPEQLSLLLLLLLVPAAASRKWRIVALLAFGYTLAYTAFHALLGLTFFYCCYELWRERRFDWKALLYPGLGCALGLVAHPQFPHNLLIWKVQSVDFFRLRAILDVGSEIAAAPADELLRHNWPWLLALLVLWRAAVPGDDQEPRDERQADLLWITAAVFGLLYLLMQRFSTYAIPFLTLALAAEIGRRGSRIGGRVRLPWRGSLPLAAGLLLALLPGILRSAWQLYGMAQEPGPIGREAEWAEFGRAVPAGAKVAAEWGTTHIYMYFAPQASYLNVLDPVFMALPYPAAYQAQRALFEGRESDGALAVKAELDSDYLAFSRFHRTPRLIERLQGDPRWTPVYQGYNLLYRLEPNKNEGFLLDWRLLPPGSAIPPPPAATVEAWAPYPRREAPAERALEAFVDLRRIPAAAKDGAGCAALQASVPPKKALELAPAGPTRLWVDGRPALAIDDDLGAILGRGVVLPLDLGLGSRRLAVLTCPPRDPAAASGGGFYLRAL